MDRQLLKRPNATETEEDLLRFQEEFLKNSSRSSTIVVDKRNNGTGENVKRYSNQETPLEEKSEKKHETKRVRINVDVDQTDDALGGRLKVQEKDDIKAQDISKLQQSFRVQERDTSCTKVSLPSMKTRPFPTVFKIKPQSRTTSGQRGSLFAQQMQLKRSNIKSIQTSEMEISADVKSLPFSIPDLKSKSVIIDGSGLIKGENQEVLVKEIHEENLKKISEMPVEEVLKARQTIMETLDPSLVAFLQAKRKSHIEPIQKLANEASTSSHDSANTNDILMEDDSHMPIVSSATEKDSTKVECFNEDELPIRPSVAKKWAHMDNVEKEKLAWMTKLPELAHEKVGNAARFDFDGKIIVNSVDIPVHQGLHHHGEEPELPGYTLDELFRFSQSSMPSQKVLGLGTLSKIISKIHEGYYDEVLTRPILPDFVAGYVVPMFRSALDDNTPQCLTVSVAVIHSLIVSTPDELSLDETFLWHRGEQQPFSQPEAKFERGDRNISEDSPSENELEDTTVVDLDIIKGFLRMDILPRLRYIIEVLRPPAPVVIQILEIIAKLARHSFESAYSIMKTPRLLTLLYDEFCTKSWTNIVENQLMDGKFTSVYGVPTHQAIKIFRNLASAHRDLASELLSKFDFMDSVLCYLSSGYQDHQLPPKEAMLLCLESLRTWQVFLHYRLTTQSYIDFYPLILRQLACFQNICINIDAETHSYDLDYAASWLKLLSVVLKLTVPATVGEQTSSDVLLKWDTVAGLLDLVEFCLSKWLWEVTTFREITRSSSRLLAAALNFVGTFYKTWSKQPTCSQSSVVQRIEKFYEASLMSFISSEMFCNITHDLRKFSTLKDGSIYKKSRNPSNLLSLNSVLWGGIVTPILDHRSPFPVMVELVRCLYIFTSLNDKLDKMNDMLLYSDGVCKYLEIIVLFDCSDIPRQWFSRFEVKFIYYLMALGSLKKDKTTQQYHKVSLKLVHLFQRGDENLIERLLLTSVFNKKFIRETEDAAATVGNSLVLDNLNIKEDGVIRNSLSIERVSHFELMLATSQSLSTIFSTYRSFLSEVLSKLGQCGWRNRNSLCISHYQVPLVPKDFFYYPIVEVYRKVNRNKSDLEHVTLNMNRIVCHCLQWCHLIDFLNREVLPPNTKLCHISMAFMCSPDIFLQPITRRYLEGCLQIMSHKRELININLNISVEGGSYNDFFVQVLDQFEAMSYGDHLFGTLILVSMQRSHPLQLRGAVWMERTSALSVICVNHEELLVPIRYYLEPIEDDENLLASFFKALLNGRVTLERNPVLYLIAIHHLHHFLFDNKLNHGLLRENIIRKVLEDPNKLLSRHLQCYTEPDVLSEFGFICSEKPSMEVLSVIENVSTKSQ